MKRKTKWWLATGIALLTLLILSLGLYIRHFWERNNLANDDLNVYFFLKQLEKADHPLTLYQIFVKSNAEESIWPCDFMSRHRNYDGYCAAMNQYGLQVISEAEFNKICEYRIQYFPDGSYELTNIYGDKKYSGKLGEEIKMK